MSEHIRDKTDEVARTDKETVVESPKSSFHLFVSFDLVNFTQFKIESNIWTKVISFFYKFFDKRVYESKFTNIQIWKFRGDEVILKWVINYITDIPTFLNYSHETSEAFEENCKKENFDEKNQYVIKVKLVAWILEAHNYNKSDNKPQGNKNNDPSLYNISFPTRNHPYPAYLDFVGPQMDAGFRLTKCSLPGVMVLSVELYYVLTKLYDDCVQSEIESRVQDIHESQNNFEVIRRSINLARTIVTGSRIVGLTRLEGVGNNAPYPIIWYCNDWEKTRGYYLSADYFDNPFLLNLISVSNGQSPIRSSTFKSTLYYKNIDTNKSFLDNLLKAATMSISKTNNHSTILHFVLILFGEQDNKIKIVLRKRADNKAIHPKKYDFGSAKITWTDNVENKIAKEYLTNMNIEVEVKIDEDFPIATFHIPDRNECGIIYAKKISENDMNQLNNAEIHNLKDVLEMDDEQLVPKAKTYINRAFKMLKNN